MEHNTGLKCVKWTDIETNLVTCTTCTKDFCRLACLNSIYYCSVGVWACCSYHTLPLWCTGCCVSISTCKHENTSDMPHIVFIQSFPWKLHPWAHRFNTGERWLIGNFQQKLLLTWWPWRLPHDPNQCTWPRYHSTWQAQTQQRMFFSAYWRISAFLRWFFTPLSAYNEPQTVQIWPRKAISAPPTDCQDESCRMRHSGRARLSSLERRFSARTRFFQTGNTTESCSNGLAQALKRLETCTTSSNCHTAFLSRIWNKILYL